MNDGNYTQTLSNIDLFHEAAAASLGPVASPTPNPDWKARAVNRLDELFDREDLRKLTLEALPYLDEHLRSTRRCLGGGDRPNRLSELAMGMLLVLQTGLFANPVIRQAVAAKTNTKAPQKWHAGGPAATEFVRATGFPDELIGEAENDERSHRETIRSTPDPRPLEDFQVETKNAMTARLRVPAGRAIVSLPTGAGKTRVAVESLVDAFVSGPSAWQDGVALWVAHTEELCEQAVEQIREVWTQRGGGRDLSLSRLFGHSFASKSAAEASEIIREAHEQPSILVCTPQSLLGREVLQGTGPFAELGNLVRALVIDEAHRAAAPTYQELIRLAGTLAHQPGVIGLTATPIAREYDKNKGTELLRETFGELITPLKTLGSNMRAALQVRGILARPVIHEFRTGARIRAEAASHRWMPRWPDNPSIELMDATDKEMAKSADQNARRTKIFLRIAEIARDSSVSMLYFGPTVEDAERMAISLRQAGIAAAVVSGKTPALLRRRVIAEFRRGSIRVLCNCEVLTTGFDAPRVTHVVMARPTVSQVLYEQMVGRGLRGSQFGGTASCDVIECVDDFTRGRRPRLGSDGFRRDWDPKVHRAPMLAEAAE